MKRLITIILALVLLGSAAFGARYIGHDDKNTSYYVCNTNSEVAELLGFKAEEFDLSKYNMVSRKTDRRTENVNIFIVMINANDTFVVCFRAEEYDIFFYSWDIEKE